MPYTLKRAPKGGWDIVKKATGEMVGHSDTMAKAKASMAIRMEAHMKKFGTK